MKSGDMFVFDACPKCMEEFTRGAPVVKLNCRPSRLQAVSGPAEQGMGNRRWSLWPRRGNSRNVPQMTDVQETWQLVPWSPQTKEAFCHQLCVPCTESIADQGPTTCPVCGTSHSNLSRRRLAAEIARLKRQGVPSVAQRIRAYRLRFSSAAALAGEACVQSVLFPALKASACVASVICCFPAVLFDLHRRGCCGPDPDLDNRCHAVALDVILVAIAGIAVIALCV